MLLAARVHRMWWALGVSIMVTGAAILLGGRYVELPQVLQGVSRPVNVVLILATLFAPLTAGVLAGEVLTVEARATRSLVSVDLLVLASLFGVPGLAAVGAWLTGHGDLAYELARDVGSFVGITLLCATVMRARTAATVAVLYLIVASTVGLGPNGRAYPWAWIRAQPSLISAVPGVLLVLGGAVAFHVWGRRITLRRPVAEEPE